MANEALNIYKQTDSDYIRGIETPHGRIKILYETIIENIENIIDHHPKTDFKSLGKCLNALRILSSSLDMEKGKELAENLNELYFYCSNKVKAYLENKDEKKLEEVSNIINGLLDAWKEIQEK